MKKSFYHYLMKYRNINSQSEISQFATDAFLDTDFPKSENDYYKLCDYLEAHGHYLPAMSVFDDAFRLYELNE